jgi:hypothetical protein
LVNIKRGSTVRPSNRILIYVIIGIIAFSAFYFGVFKGGGNNINSNNNPTTTGLIASSKKQAIENYQKQFCGIGTESNSDSYITEYRLPANCEMPLGIVVVDMNNNNTATAGKVWYVSTKMGL